MMDDEIVYLYLYIYYIYIYSIYIYVCVWVRGCTLNRKKDEQNDKLFVWLI